MRILDYLHMCYKNFDTRKIDYYKNDQHLTIDFQTKYTMADILTAGIETINVQGRELRIVNLSERGLHKSQFPMSILAQYRLSLGDCDGVKYQHLLMSTWDGELYWSYVRNAAFRMGELITSVDVTLRNTKTNETLMRLPYTLKFRCCGGGVILQRGCPREYPSFECDCDPDAPFLFKTPYPVNSYESFLLDIQPMYCMHKNRYFDNKDLQKEEYRMNTLSRDRHLTVDLYVEYILLKDPSVINFDNYVFEPVEGKRYILDVDGRLVRLTDEMMMTKACKSKGESGKDDGEDDGEDDGKDGAGKEDSAKLDS